MFRNCPLFVFVDEPINKFEKAKDFIHGSKQSADSKRSTLKQVLLVTRKS